MRHFSCDLCGKTLEPVGEARYLVRLEGTAVTEEPLSGYGETEADSVDAMDEFLTEQVAFEATEEDRDTVEMPPVCAKREYDLCRACYARLLNDPLGLTARHAPGFSRN